jgi:small ligand-binding sensory domain FIST
MASALVQAQLRAQLAQGMTTENRAGESEGVPQAPASLGLIYLTDHFAPQAQDILDHFMAALPEVTDWVGTVGVGIAATGVEYFDEPAMAVMLLTLPADQFRVFSGVVPLSASAVADGVDGFSAHTALVHADGATPDLSDLLAELAQRTTSGQVFGGLTSSRGVSVQLAHSSRGALAGQGAATGVFSGGLSGVAFGPDVALVSRVTQGCTPVGPTHTLTQVDGHLALALDGQDALGVLLDDLAITLDQPQRAMETLRATLVGLSPNVPPDGPTAIALQRGQFGSEVKVRHIMGLDPTRKAVAVADHLVPGQQLAFCVRNPAAARADLLRMCAEIREEVESPATEADGLFGTPPGVPARAMLGAIYVSCAGRGGPHLGAPHAELQLVRRALGDVPLVGFFAGGEIAHQQLYGYTGVLTVFLAPPH